MALISDDMQQAFEIVSRLSARLSADENHNEMRHAIQRYFGDAHAGLAYDASSGPASSRRF